MKLIEYKSEVILMSAVQFTKIADCVSCSDTPTNEQEPLTLPEFGENVPAVRESPSLFGRVKKILASPKCWVITAVALGALTAATLGVYHGLAASLSRSNISTEGSFNNFTQNLTTPFPTTPNSSANISKDFNLDKLPPTLAAPFPTTLNLTEPTTPDLATPNITEPNTAITPTTPNITDCQSQPCHFASPSVIKLPSAPENNSLCNPPKKEYIDCMLKAESTSGARYTASLLSRRKANPSLAPCKPKDWTIKYFSSEWERDENKNTPRVECCLSLIRKVAKEAGAGCESGQPYYEYEVSSKNGWRIQKERDYSGWLFRHVIYKIWY